MNNLLIAILFIAILILYPFIFCFIFVLVSDVQMPGKHERPKTIRDVLTIIFYDDYVDNSNYNSYAEMLWSVQIPFLGFFMAIFWTFVFTAEYILEKFIKFNPWVKDIFRKCKNVWDKFLDIKIVKRK